MLQEGKPTPDLIESVFDLPNLTSEQFDKAMEAAGGNTEDTYAILLRDGSFVFREGSHDARTSSVTEDMVACGYLGTGEKKADE